MKYLLKLANGEGKGYFEVATKYTFDNLKFAIADDGKSPRYEPNTWVIVNEDSTLTVHLTNGGAGDLGIIMRALGLPAAPASVNDGFIREPAFVKFIKGNSTSMLEVATGTIYKGYKAA
jgi:hypothetical protein